MLCTTYIFPYIELYVSYCIIVLYAILSYGIVLYITYFVYEYVSLISSVTTAGALDVGRFQRDKKAVCVPTYVVFHGVQRARHGTGCTTNQNIPKPSVLLCLLYISSSWFHWSWSNKFQQVTNENEKHERKCCQELYSYSTFPVIIVRLTIYCFFTLPWQSRDTS